MIPVIVSVIPEISKNRTENPESLCHFLGAMLYHLAMDNMIIPWDSLSDDALVGIIEEFITREGTEYGAVEVSLPEKVNQIRRQLELKQVNIVFDAELGSASLCVSSDRS